MSDDDRSGQVPESTVVAEKRADQRGDERGGIMRGFSLIELLVVIAIISILVGIGFLSMLHYGMVIRVNASARDLGGHMRVARAEAISSGTRYLFRFSPDQTYLYGPSNVGGNGFAGSVKSNLLQEGIVFGVLSASPAVPGHHFPPCGINIHLNGAADCATRDVLVNRDGTFNVDGVAYMIPAIDRSGTGVRDDRQRAVDWSASSGRVRVWRYFASMHDWR